MTSQDYLTRLLTTYWFAPPVALWRAVELRVAAEETYRHPLLDLGCGDGLIARDLFGTEQPIDVGMDPWSEQLRQAVRSRMYRHIDLAEGKHLPYTDRSFATVFSNSVLEHVPDVAPILNEIARVLSPGGRFIFTVPSDAFRPMLDGYAQRAEKGELLAARVYAGTVDAALQHYHYHAPEEWEALLNVAGMRLVRFRYYLPGPAVRFWDRANPRYGIGNRCSIWRLLVSPRLRKLGYQALIKALVVQILSRRWRTYYEMEVSEGEKGGGLLIVAQEGS